MWRARQRNRRGAASDSDLLESSASDILSDSFTYEDADTVLVAITTDCRQPNSIYKLFIRLYARTYDEPPWRRNNESFTIERINVQKKNKMYQIHNRMDLVHVVNQLQMCSKDSQSSRKLYGKFFLQLRETATYFCKFSSRSRHEIHRPFPSFSRYPWLI